MRLKCIDDRFFGPTFLALRDLRLWVQCNCGAMLKCGAVKACH